MFREIALDMDETITSIPMIGSTSLPRSQSCRAWQPHPGKSRNKENLMLAHSQVSIKKESRSFVRRTGRAKSVEIATLGRWLILCGRPLVDHRRFSNGYISIASQRVLFCILCLDCQNLSILMWAPTCRQFECL